MKKNYKIFLVPAIIIIIAGFFSGYGRQSYDKIAIDLLKERTNILQKAYYGHMELEKAEAYLSKIETYPLLSEDIQGLRSADPACLDIIRSMEFVEIGNMSKMFDYISFYVQIRWYMSGLDGDYICENDYVVVLKETNSGLKLSEFNAR
ncbi:MAG: hypothetical protein ACOX5F_04895 [Anaerovoracaceae bacterium]